MKRTLPIKGGNLVQARRLCGLNLNELVEASGVSPSSIQRAEKGHATMPTLHRIVDALLRVSEGKVELPFKQAKELLL